MPPQKFGGGHEDFQREMDALRRLRGEAEGVTRAEQQVVRETERATEAEKGANRQRVQRNRLEQENADAAARQRAVRGIKPDPDIQANTTAIEANTRARLANADAMAKQAAEARRAQQARERENLIARGAAAGTLAVLPVGAAGRFGIKETTTGQRVSGAFASQEAANRRLASLMEEQLAVQRQMTQASLERLRNERALVVQGRREIAAQVHRTRSMELHGEVIDGEIVQERAQGRIGAGGRVPPGGAGALPPGTPPYRQIPYRGELVRHDLFGQRDYGPAYDPYVGRGVQHERGGASDMYGQVGKRSEEAGRAAERAYRANERLAGAEARAAATSRLAAVEFGTANQALYKHGALTSEFVQAAYRGEVTMRDLANQVGITIGKFAGWTVAATLVYGVVRAIGQLGHGAIESNRAVAELGRYIDGLNTDKARQQIRDLAREMNMPIEDVAHQFEASARLTGDVQRRSGPEAAQDEAARIARSTLLLARVGELDPDVAQRYTAALTTGFKLSGDQLGDLIDGLNELQNRMNIPFDVSAQAAATAAGTVRAAGGSPEVLNALVAAGRRGSGFSGQILGTTFSRAATMIARPTNRTQLQGFGIDPDQTFDEIFTQAMQQVRSGKVRGRDVTRLATALSTPQLAGRGVTQALQNPALFDEARRRQQHAEGSATKELHQILKAVDEEIHRIGVNLARLGSALEQSGVLTPLGVMLKMLNLTLGAAVRLVETFDRLPRALREPVVLLAEMAAAMALLRRGGVFAASGAISARFPQLQALDRPDARLKGQIVRGAREQVEFANASREAATRGYAQAAFREEAHVTTAAAFRDDYNTRKRRGTLPARGTDARIALDDQMAVHEGEIAASERRLAEAKRETLAAQRYVLRSQEELTAAQSLSTAEARRYAVVNQIPYPASNRHPDARGAQQLPIMRNLEGEHGRPTDVLAYMNQAEREMGLYDTHSTAELSKLRQRTDGFGQRIRTWGDQARGAGVAANAGARVAARSVELAGRAGDSIGRMARSLGGLGPGMRGVFEALGPLDYALIGIPAAIMAGDAIRDSVERHSAAVDALSGANPNDRRDNERILEEGRKARARQKQGPNFLENVVGLPFGFIGGAAGQQAGARGARAVWNRLSGVDSAANAARENEELEKTIARQQARQRQRGKPLPQRWYEDILRDITNVRRSRENFTMGAQEYQEELDKLTVEVQTGRGGRRGFRLVTQALATARAEVGDVRAARGAVGRLDDKGLQELIGAEAAQLQQFGTGTTEGKGARLLLLESYRSASQRFAGLGDPGSVAALAQARSAVFQAIEQSATTDLQFMLGGAGSERERREAYRQAGAQYDEALRYARDRGDKAAEQMALTGQRAVQAAGFQDRQQGREVYSQARQAATADPEARARDAERTAERSLRDARETGNNRDVQTALAQVRNARAQRIKTELESLRSESELQTARGAQDPVSQARAAARTAQRTYNFMQEHRRQFSPTERRDALRAVIEANRAVDQSIIQAANDLTDLQTQIAQAQHEGDPVAQANDALRGALSQRLDPNDPLSGERRRLGVIQARNQQRDAARDLARAQSEFRTAQAGDDPRVQAQEAIRNDRLAIGQAVRGSADWWRARAQLLGDQRQLREANADYQQARFEYMASLTSDPVRQANLQVRSARAGLRGTTGAARLRALAALRNAQRNAIQTRVQQREGDIDFNLEMEKITRDEAISQLQSLSRTRGITKDVRRDILRRIKALQQESEQEASGFALDVGQIKLPTIYDVRRAVGGVSRAAVSGGRYNMRSDVTFNIQVNDQNAAETVYGQIDRAMRTNVRAKMRTAGMRG